MELTYENMKQRVMDYFDGLPSISGPEDKDRIREFFAPDFLLHVFHYDDIEDLNREEWVDHLCGHPDDYRATVSYQPPPLTIMVDDRKKQAVVLMYEEFLHPATGQDVKPREYTVATFEFCIHDGKIKARREMILALDFSAPEYIWGSL